MCQGGHKKAKCIIVQILSCWCQEIHKLLWFSLSGTKTCMGGGAPQRKKGWKGTMSINKQINKQIIKLRKISLGYTVRE